MNPTDFVVRVTDMAMLPLLYFLVDSIRRVDHIFRTTYPRLWL